MKTVVHIIDGLGRGGTETLLVDLLPHLSQHYRIILVTGSSQNEFGNQVFQNCEAHYCLHHSGPKDFFRSVWRLRKIIRAHQPDLVRSQLVLSSVLARLATPARIPLVVSIHNTLSALIPKSFSGRLIRWIEANVHRKNMVLVGVTQAIVDDYREYFHYKGQHRILYNYVRDVFFDNKAIRTNSNGKLRVVAVGNLRPQKNYPFILKAFGQLKNSGVELDIYGDGPLRSQLEKTIAEEGLAVTLKGKVADVSAILPDYDLFLMLSSFEGFGIAVAEAMAANKPLILSDIPVLREITESRAIFISLDSPANLAETFQNLANNRQPLEAMVLSNRQRAERLYSREAYLQNLASIYDEALGKA